MRNKLICLFFVTILLASCGAPIPQPTATAVPTSTRTPVPIPTATRTLKPPSDSEPSWIRNDDELFIFDPVSSEWIRAAQDADTDLPVYEADGKKIILVGDEWLAVTIEAGADNKITATTEDGQQWKWGEQGWEAGLHQAEYWLNPDGTVKPGEVIPSGCLQVEGKDTCVFNPAASPAIYEGLLKVIYNFTVSFGGNPGKFWDKSGDWSEREARLPGAADQFVQACREGQIFHDLTNMERWMGGERGAQKGRVTPLGSSTRDRLARE